MATTYTLKTPAIAHKAFRAYLGVHAAAFEAFTTRKDTAQKFSNEQFGDFAARGLKIEDSVSALFSKAPKFCAPRHALRRRYNGWPHAKTPCC